MLARCLSIFKRLSGYHSIQARSFHWDTPFSTTKKDRDIYITPKKADPTHTLIWMHGLGDSAMGFVDFFDRDDSLVPLNTKVILLTAPEMEVTLNNGYIMNSWFDQEFGKNGGFVVKKDDVLASYYRISKVIDEEVQFHNNDYKKMFIGGFSQGCSMALHTGLSFHHTLGGICGLSGFLFDFTKIDEKKKDIPIFIYHGKMDDMVLCDLSVKDYKEKLIEKGFNVKLKLENNLGHGISRQEDIEIRKFFKEVMI